jgi:hypothetical protein
MRIQRMFRRMETGDMASLAPDEALIIGVGRRRR